MPGPLTRFLGSRIRTSQTLDLYEQAVEQKWDIPDDRLGRVKDALYNIATDERFKGRALKAARLIQQGINDDRKNRLELLKLILEDAAIEERPTPIRNQTNVAAVLNIEQVHDMLDALASAPTQLTTDTVEENE